ncbi:TonB-dependent receptor plug domain-containing protein [Tamlana sp. 2201CG12-4]|uniref:TonB-dependent receptor plug domain-containing protein n=1 Tax=Tamlana sp. 2201CG12-4 TaxID=3112582 RepID=UPI002DB96C28|nr:TonB-dependent receptor plug domain-containing protein [Tamlana sp. 2201CG12-4]MEC3905398.1 TonB-dependent receptor plug domain-containing protein [Tamlana sp. 2201CG12-4]
MIKKILFGFSIIVFLSFTFTNNFRELVFEKLEKYTNSFPEKIYVQTDKPYYSIGDDLWYTAYLVNGVTHQRSQKSRIVYVELIDEQDSIIAKKQLFTNDLSVAGDFKIKKNFKEGHYLLRAYTNYMRNNDSDYFFQKEIPIWNLTESDDTTEKIIATPKVNTENNQRLASRPKINFYPESGNLINGLFCKVAISAKDNKDNNIDIQGYIKDSDNNVISSFKTFDYGLGLITLNPEVNKSYFASVIINDEELKYPLPKALSNGHNLNVANYGNQIIINVSSNDPIGLKNSFLVGHLRGDLIFEKLETENIDTYTIKLNTKLLPDGVANFTLFNSSGKPVCERLVFVDSPDNDVAVNVSMDKTLPKTREKVTMQLDLKDEEGNALSGNLSMSITDIDVVAQSTKSENIKTYLLLNSDLRGSIENPGYFFEKNDDPKKRYLLDLIMLTNGWRRFTWTNLLDTNTEQKDKFQPETGLYISGYTKALKGDKERISTATRITFMGKPPYQDKKQSDQNGAFKYGPFVFSDSIPTLIEARTKSFKSDNERKNRFVSIFLDEPLYDSPKVIRNKIFKPFLDDDSSKITNFINQAKKIAAIDSLYLEQATLLDEVVITARKKAEEEKRREELNQRTNYGSPSNRVDMADFDDQRHLSIFDFLNMLPGVTAYNDSISIRNQGTPRIVVDGIPVELSEITYMTGNEIDFIDVLKGADAAAFSNAGNGVVAIYTRTGDFNRNINVKRKPGIIDFTATGFYTAREFYAPDHINGFDEALKQDIRTTLHWEPKIVLTDDASRAEVSFFTSDARSIYGIKIEGITDTGIPVYHLTTLEVD